MPKLRIVDEDILIRIIKVISWLDSIRWQTPENYNYVNYFSDDLTNSEKVLTHWICYITDRQKPFEIIWDKGGYIFSELVYDYSRNKINPKGIFKKYLEEYKDKKQKVKLRYRSIKDSSITFASRYTNKDNADVLQTLELLSQNYNRNIITYIIDIIKRFEDKEDLLIRVASALWLLTYFSGNEQFNILENEENFENLLESFKKNSIKGKKRLWCCIRDYKKGIYHTIFTNAIREAAGNEADNLIKKWNNLPFNQLELPGDVWNNSPLFRNNLFSKVLDLDLLPKTWGLPKTVREIYNILINSKLTIDFYPEQFDITFDFVPRMCNKKLCNICLFGDNGVDLLCIPTDDKYCPVVLTHCGYIIKCIGKQKKCIIKDGISKGICSGALK